MMGTETIYFRMFSRRFMYTVYQTFNDKYYKNITNEHNNVSIIMGSEVKFNIFLRLLTGENIIFMSKIVR